MIKLTVIRHAQSLGNVKGIIDDNSNPKNDKNGLSNEGKLDAEKIAKKLEGKRFDVVIVSPLKRAIETLEPYLKNKDLKVIKSDLIIERNAGVFVGKPKPSLKEYCLKNNITDRVNFRPENGESIKDVYKRAKKFLDYIKNSFEGKSILLCGHVNFLGCLDIAIKVGNIKDYYFYEPLKNGEIREYNID